MRDLRCCDYVFVAVVGEDLSVWRMIWGWNRTDLSPSPPGAVSIRLLVDMAFFQIGFRLLCSAIVAV